MQEAIDFVKKLTGWTEDNFAITMFGIDATDRVSKRIEGRYIVERRHKFINFSFNWTE